MQSPSMAGLANEASPLPIDSRVVHFAIALYTLREIFGSDRLFLCLSTKLSLQALESPWSWFMRLVRVIGSITPAGIAHSIAHPGNHQITYSALSGHITS